MAPFKKKTREMSTADADAKLLEVLTLQGADLSNPRSVRHLLFAEREEEVPATVKRLELEGFTVTTRKSAAGEKWLVLAERTEVVSAASVAAGRILFERLAATMHGGEYDGWEASVPELKGTT